MLEKIGLPPKPSMRGSNWVVDASHCQGCSSQFTFINRKHHCRRCGGLFCNSCTHQRMYLRGQGDSPVRICDPCKTLEEAARFELRHGNKTRSAKGQSKQAQKPEDEILSQILGTSVKRESDDIAVSDLLRAASNASTSSLKEASAGDSLIDIESSSPEKLRQQAVEEKKKYKILKGEGKADEALQTFKRAKELERQAGALEIAIRKNKRLATKASNLSTASTQEIDNSEESVSKIKSASRKGKEEKNDLASELKELGWSEADLNETDTKPVNQSVESELSNLLGEVSGKKAGGVDKSQVLALKKKALQLKREGKLSEAKEELKKAKILEKQLEEQELLGESEESDDELAALIRNMDDNKHDDYQLNNALLPNINFDQFGALGDNFDITDDDMNDPELAGALKSFGWTEEDENESPLDQEALRGKVLTLKREALSEKRAGNAAEAMALLKKAKLLEKDLEPVPAEENIPKLPPKSKLTIQKELLAIKKKALALRREGKTDEADEELNKGKILEQELEEMENGPKRPVPKVVPKNLNMGNFDTDIGEEAEVTDQDMNDPALMSVLKNLGWNEDDNTESKPVISRKPMSKSEIQKELLALKRKALGLRRQGKNEEAEEELERAKDLEKQLAEMEASSSTKPIEVQSQAKPDFIHKADGDLSSLLSNISKDEETYSKSEEAPTSHINTKVEETNKTGISPQKEEVLARKRKALALKREGKLAEAREELRQAKLLEKTIEETIPQTVPQVALENKPKQEVAPKPLSSRDRFKLQQESLSHKRKALKLRREGKIEESEAEFELAKALESQLEEFASPKETNDVGIEDLLDPQLMSALKSIGWEDGDIGAHQTTVAAESSKKPEPTKVGNSQGERTRLEEMIKKEKVRALNLKREGKQAEALEALRSAKLMEKKLASVT